MKPDGSDLRQVTDYGGSGMINPLWSPDGSRMAGLVQSSNKVLLFDPRKPWQDQTPEELPRLDEGKILCAMESWSPDGRRLACESELDPVTSGGIFAYSLESKTYEKLTDSGYFPAWLGDSRRLLFESREGKLFLLNAP